MDASNESGGNNMTTTTVQVVAGAASPLSEARSTEPAANQSAAEPLRHLLIHDIRTPLAAISGYAALTASDHRGESDVASLAESLRGIEEAARRVGHLLDELTDLALMCGEEGTNHQR
jgi:signal transduction histidine kinase